MTTTESGSTSRPTYRAKDIARVFEQIAPLELGNPGDQLGFIYGSPETVVKGIGCLWNVHSKSLSLAVEQVMMESMA